MGDCGVFWLYFPASLSRFLWLPAMCTSPWLNSGPWAFFFCLNLNTSSFCLLSLDSFQILKDYLQVRSLGRTFYSKITQQTLSYFFLKCEFNKWSEEVVLSAWTWLLVLAVSHSIELLEAGLSVTHTEVHCEEMDLPEVSEEDWAAALVISHECHLVPLLILARCRFQKSLVTDWTSLEEDLWVTILFHGRED